MKLETKYMSAFIGLGIVIMVIAGALLNYLSNPYWIAFFLGTIIITGLITLVFYFIFLWEFIESKHELEIKKLELELEKIKKL